MIHPALLTFTPEWNREIGIITSCSASVSLEEEIDQLA
jgi:hypothetical protein